MRKGGAFHQNKIYFSLQIGGRTTDRAYNKDF